MDIKEQKVNQENKRHKNSDHDILHVNGVCGIFKHTIQCRGGDCLQQQGYKYLHRCMHKFLEVILILFEHFETET